MFDYTYLGGRVSTPQGIGLYLGKDTDGQVLVVFDYNHQPVGYPADQVYLV